MAKRPRKTPPARNGRALLIGGVLASLVVIGAATYLFTRPSTPAAPVAWATLGSRDVHSLAFVGGDPDHLLFGHHDGLEETKDGGRTWSSLPVREDAMSVSAGADGSIVIAGHEVFVASRDGGRT